MVPIPDYLALNILYSLERVYSVQHWCRGQFSIQERFLGTLSSLE